MQVIPHQIIRLKGCTPENINFDELNEQYYIEFRGEWYWIEDEYSIPLGKNSFDIMLIDEYNENEGKVAVIRGVK